MEIPAVNTTLYGRENELQQIALHLDDPAHRLVSLVGPGGIGKTSLGIEAARRYGDRTKDGAVFIDLQAIDQHELVIQRLADALQLSIQSRENALAQITQFLDGTETLLYFDNFERVTEAAPLISEILNLAPGATALVTSRTPLHLTQEWILQVDGLPVPAADSHHPAKENAATQLFIDRATQVRPDLEVEQNTPAIEKICQIVEGMPLAIEIAASLTRVLECSEIADELQKNHALLESNMRDVPERHRSIDSIFNQSMSMLDPAERQGFEKLSIFRGGFTRHAATAIAGTSLATLSALTDRSLIRLVGSGRYRIHELIRQFGAEQLAKDEAERSAIEKVHSVYFMDFLSARHIDLTVKRQVEVANEIEADSENVLTAWNYAVNNVSAKHISEAVTAYGQFIQYRGRYATGGHTFSQAVERFSSEQQTPEVQKALALLLIEHGRFSLRQGNLDQAQQAYSESEKLHSALKIQPNYGLLMDPQLGYAYLESTRGNIDQAVTHAEAVLANALEQNHQLHIAMANQLLGHLALRCGNLTQARKHDQVALTTCTDLGERWFIAYCHNELGEVDVAEADYEAATEHFTQSLNISSEFGDRANIGLAQTCLGEVAMLDGRHDDAAQFFEESMLAYQQLGDKGGTARVQSGLGTLAVATGNFGTAYHHLTDVLDTATEMQFSAMTLDALEGIGELALKTDHEHEGHQILEFVDSHQSTDSRTRARLRKVFTPENSQNTENGTLDKFVDLARNYLFEIRNDIQDDIAATDPARIQTNSAQQLPEPLTERELEILSRITQGLPNQQIGDELFISLGTVKWYNNQIYTKLGVHNRTSAVAKARDLGLIAADE